MALWLHISSTTQHHSDRDAACRRAHFPQQYLHSGIRRHTPTSIVLPLVDLVLYNIAYLCSRCLQLEVFFSCIFAIVTVPYYQNVLFYSREFICLLRTLHFAYVHNCSSYLLFFTHYIVILSHFFVL
jgi:hypothetical protein